MFQNGPKDGISQIPLHNDKLTPDEFLIRQDNLDEQE